MFIKMTALAFPAALTLTQAPHFAQAVVTLSGVTGLNVDDMLGNGNLIV